MAVRTRQKERTRQAIAAAAQELVVGNAEVTMPAVAARAGVSEATAYRYYPDLVTLLRETVGDTWPAPAEMVPLDGVDDLTERVARVATAFAERTIGHEATVRAIVAASLTGRGTRAAHRFALIEHALTPLPESPTRAALATRLAVVISAESVFTLLDLCGLDPDAATAALRDTAVAVVTGPA
ncbi:TetR/AcrR family transcriptional regulator [Actinomycetospora sp. NBRC 106378]|uniref:TetR/AcrR family transcriptional regulator n=1 Tax=Actinomycetospora sp. NBRC 106378 TaxID=3032208 RepID=UPI0024A010C2|nr:TetR/AcrR family transcriptional regulator [Actinomycetospora sp. NBRC 106378]GLZ51466.1 TetR family transcriptional regulator [Actinomycetospora sp. NBRC 106378]